MSIAPDSKTPLTSQTPAELMRLPVGVVSPLWGLFAGAAVTGAAWWWMTRWARPENLEAMFAQSAKAQDTVLEAVEITVAALPEPLEAPPAVEAVVAEAETVIEAAADPVIEVVEAIAEPVAEAVEAAPDVAAEAIKAVAEVPATAAEVLAEAPAEVIEPVAEAIEAASDVAAETLEAVAETPATVAEVLAEAPAEAVEPVGGESAPIAPAVEAAAKPAKRKTGPKAVDLPAGDA